MMAILSNPNAIYIIGMSLVLFLALIFCLSIYCYFKAKDHEPYIYKIEELISRINELNSKINDAKEEYKDKLAEITEGEHKIQAGKQAEEFIKSKQREIETLRKDIISVHSDHEDAELRLKDSQRKLDELNNDLKTKAGVLESQEKELEGIKKERRETEEKIETLKAEDSILKGSIERLKNEKDDWNKDVENLKIIIEDKRKELNKLKDEIANRDSELKDIENKAKSLKSSNEQLIEQNEKLEKQINSNREENNELLNKVEQNKLTIARGEALKLNTINMWNDLERKPENITELPNEYLMSIDEDEEKDVLDSLLDNLKESNYIFHERTIYAFHTGLLCGDISPLVVLAGISGTGKSLLPSLYAKFLGMQFLPVAVQPRWDGPQDVFGFYNHMEGRFKATELSRHLWYFDWFNNKECKARYPKREDMPMSIILLDEMNLARVEYYFSELLSKLELRRTISENDKEDEKERFKAEVELEYGAPSIDDIDKNIGKRIFIDNNILFVGTMNEDESTQTLSSKVIDRSNVLHFGTPSSLDNLPDDEKFKNSCESFIQFGIWRKWAKKKGAELNSLHDMIETLKQALNQADRGFGHRTENAIRTYIDFYPGDKCHAMADQIEMKILPKLNGCDMDKVKDRDVKNKIQKVLELVNDKELENAFEDSLRAETTFFSWKGVHR